MGDPSESVQRIIERLQAGPSREEDFRQLFDLYYSRVHHFFAKRGFPPQECLDLTQETFIGIYRGIASFRRDARFETWLFKIATNAYRKRLRWGVAEKRDAVEMSLDCGEESHEPADPASEEESMLRAERARLLREAVEKLPEQMRRCLMLRVYQDMRYREIATVMRLSPETVKVHLFQARRRLREDLGSYFHDAIPDEAVPDKAIR
jgi:RNA polymerase sigma-70 factor, ECF subfamily